MEGEGRGHFRLLSTGLFCCPAPDKTWRHRARAWGSSRGSAFRSGEIQEILGEMLTTFTDNRNEAVAAEDKAVRASHCFASQLLLYSMA